MVKVPEGYRSKNVEDRRSGGSRSRSSVPNASDLLGGMLGSNATGGGLLGSLLRGGALTSILGGMFGGGGGSGGSLGSILDSVRGEGGNGGPSAAAVSNDDPERANEDATILIRAMINAAKADGQIDQSEIDNIVGRLGEIDKNEAAFLKQELAAPLDVEDFCRDVSPNMAQQAYAFSVMGMKLDTQHEARYLGAVAQGLSLDPQICNGIHEKLGVPKIFG